MRGLRVVLRFMRKLWNGRSKPSPGSHSISSIDPQEFSDLLGSGRKTDLETLAKRLSEHHQRSRVKIRAKRMGQGAANSKGTGVAK
jgi:hypothetical protein